MPIAAYPNYKSNEPGNGASRRTPWGLFTGLHLDESLPASAVIIGPPERIALICRTKWGALGRVISDAKEGRAKERGHHRRKLLTPREWMFSLNGGFSAA